MLLVLCRYDSVYIGKLQIMSFISLFYQFTRLSQNSELHYGVIVGNALYGMAQAKEINVSVL